MTLVFDENVGNFVYVEEEFPFIKYLIDGYVYAFGEYSALVIGGAYSVDKYYRLEKAAATGQEFSGWFSGEQLTQEEMELIAEGINGQSYDFVLSHTCPLSFQPTDLFLPVVDQSKVDKSMEIWMEEIKDTFDWGVWCFAHYHTDRIQAERVEIFYHNITNLNEIWEFWYAD